MSNISMTGTSSAAAPHHGRAWADLLGRIGFSVIFFLSGFNKLFAISATTQAMASKGIPFPSAAIAVTIVVELACATAVVLGYRTRVAALILFIWLIPVTLSFHAFWAVDTAQQQAQRTQFLKNLAIAGGALILFANGAGPLSINGRKRKTATA